MNKLIVIGDVGDNRVYLNVDKVETVKRYIKSEGIRIHIGSNKPYEFITVEKFTRDKGINVQEIEFDDEFGAYEIYK